MSKKFFEKQVDKRSKNSMIAFLSNHSRYSTMNSWNGTASYSNSIKVYSLGLTREQVNRAFDLLQTEFWDQIRDPIDDFTEEQNGRWTIGVNGRSGGYLVLYHAHYETTEHKSRCRCCGQLNFKRVAEMKEGTPQGIIGSEILRSQNSWHPESYLTQSAILAIDLPQEEKLRIIRNLKVELKDATADAKCGRCGAPDGRVNLARPIRRLVTEANRGFEDAVDLGEMSLSELRNRVELVQSFDRACDEIRENFISLIDNSEVVEEVVMIPKKIMSIRHIRQ